MQSYLEDLKQLINAHTNHRMTNTDFAAGRQHILNSVTSKVMHRWSGNVDPIATRAVYNIFKLHISSIVALVIDVQLMSAEIANSSTDNIHAIADKYLELVGKIDEMKSSTFTTAIGQVPAVDGLSRIIPDEFRLYSYADKPFFDMVQSAFTSEYYEPLYMYEKAFTNFPVFGAVGGLFPLAAVLTLNAATFISRQIDTSAPRSIVPQAVSQTEVELAFPQTDVPSVFRVQIPNSLSDYFTREALTLPAYDGLPMYCAADPFPIAEYDEPFYCPQTNELQGPSPAPAPAPASSSSTFTIKS